MLAQDWTLHYERSNFLETGRYEEAVSYCRRLAKASPYARVVEYGTSSQGRKMVALLISRDKAFDSVKMRASKKPLIFIQNGIHSGEIEGKDATLMLARDMLITGKEKALYEGANLVIVPIFNVDGHERFSPYNRINQNGPREMGWRGTAQNINLNRDWMKADTPEMQAQVRLVQRFRPDFLFDNHTTDGSDHPYVLTLGIPMSGALSPALRAWQRNYYNNLKVRTDADGFLTSPYFALMDESDPSKGITVEDFSPRYSNGYWGAMNRPSVLVETHVLKPYRQRVDATYSLMRHTIAHCIGNAAALKAMNAQADAEEAAGRPLGVLTVKRTNESRPFNFKAYPYTPYRSEVTGGVIQKWDRTKIQDIPSRVFDIYEPAITVAPPAAYAIPPEWTDAIARIELHGLRTERLRKPLTKTFMTYRLETVTFPAAPFEGRFQPRFKPTLVPQERTLPAGTVIVRVNQVGSKLLMNLLEPEAPDSLLKWGLFNNVFETKEYYEEYAMEPVAVEMLQKDPILKAEYEAKVKAEPAFAANPSGRLRWLFERSPYYDPKLNRYPVVRLEKGDLP
jgi:hypothetical protein